MKLSIISTGNAQEAAAFSSSRRRPLIVPFRHPHHDHNHDRNLEIPVRTCETDEPTEQDKSATKAYVEEWVRQRTEETGGRSLVEGIPFSPVSIPTYYHVIQNSATEGAITDAKITEQHNVLNAAYAGTGFSFKKMPTSTTINATWYNSGKNTVAELTMKKTLRKGGSDALNVYFKRFGVRSTLLGHATFPDKYAGAKDKDGVVIVNDSLPGSSRAPFDKGDTLVHEAGHWLGLYHVFEGGCTGTGDAVDDTPPQKTKTSGCPVNQDSCPGGGKDSVKNFMDYSDDSCMDRFTPGQVIRMQALWDLRRQTAKKLDVVFVVDISGSFYDDLPKFKAQAPTIISNLKTKTPDSKFGLVVFSDYPVDDYGGDEDTPYERKIDLTDDDGAVLAKINELTTLYGADRPESQLTALYQAASGTGQAPWIPAGQQTNFRPEAVKVFTLWTDAEFHDESAHPGPTFWETMKAIEALGAGSRRELQEGEGIVLTPFTPRVAGLCTHTSLGDCERIALATGAVAPPGGVDCNGDGSPDISGGGPIVCSPDSSGIGDAIVEVVDAVVTSVAPVAVCADPITVATDQGACSATGVSIDAGSSSPDGTPLTVRLFPVEPYPLGTTQVTLLAILGSNGDMLTSTCGTPVTVEDTEDPKISVPASTVVQCDSVPDPPNPYTIVTDNCGIANVDYSETPSLEICIGRYTLVRQWSAVDLSGNTATGEQTIAVEDTKGPEISCNLHYIGPNEVNQQNPKLFQPSATDNCDPSPTVEIAGRDCYALNKQGKRIDRNRSCDVQINGSDASIFISGGVGTMIDFLVTAKDNCANRAERICNVAVRNPTAQE